MSGYRLRYVAGAHNDRFATIRYPSPWRQACPTKERAEVLRQAMPDPEKFEICEDGD